MQINKKYGVIIFVAVLICIMLWFGRYTVLYQYYLWRLNNTTEANDALNISDNIESISNHIIPSLARTYEDDNVSSKVRNAAARSLVKVDRDRAETISLGLLNNKDIEVLRMAIFILGEAKSLKAYNAIIPFADSKDEKIRWAVVTYLGNFHDDKSRAKLNQVAQTDKSEQLRDWATFYLKQIKESNSK